MWPSFSLRIADFGLRIIFQIQSYCFYHFWSLSTIWFSPMPFHQFCHFSNQNQISIPRPFKFAIRNPQSTIRNGLFRNPQSEIRNS